MAIPWVSPWICWLVGVARPDESLESQADAIASLCGGTKGNESLSPVRRRKFCPIHIVLCQARTVVDEELTGMMSMPSMVEEPAGLVAVLSQVC